MKNGNLKLVGLFLIGLMYLSCESDNQSEFTGGYDSLDVVSAQASVQEGEWRVAQYRDDDDDDDDDFFQTIDFEGYVFEFSENGTVTATFGEETYTGTWRIELDDDDYDEDNDDRDEMEFELEFNNANGALYEISEDWDVLEYSNTRIRLGDDDDDELLVFERI